MIELSFQLSKTGVDLGPGASGDAVMVVVAGRRLTLDNRVMVG